MRVFLAFRQPWLTSSSELTEELSSFESDKTCSCKLIGQFFCDDTGCKIQVAHVSCDWSLSIRRWFGLHVFGSFMV